MESPLQFPLLMNDDHVRDVKIPIKVGGWKSSIYIIGVEVAERFAYFGTSGNLITYLTKVLGESTATAAKNVNVWSGVATLLSLLGAFIADSYLGRFNTILISSFIYLLGLVMLMTSISVIPLKFRHVFFFLSLYMVAIGNGGHKPCIQTFGADQFDENNVEERKAKSSFFNWWFFGLCGGATVGMLIVFYVQENIGWSIGFGISAIAMLFSLVLFLIGAKFYHRHIPTGSPLIRVVQVFVAASRKQHLVLSSGDEFATEIEGNRELAHTNQFKCLDKATIIDHLDAENNTRNKWRLCSTTQVEEVKLILRLIPIWLSCLMYAVIQAQLDTFFTKQGSSMNTQISPKLKVPAASLLVVTGTVIIITAPIYDKIFVPITRKYTGIPSGITILQRVGIGMFLSTLSMAVAGLVESRRVEIAREYGLVDKPNIIVPMSICWLIPQYVITGLSDVFTMVGLQELFYDQMPDSMRSIGSAVYLSVLGVGSLLSSVVISLVQFVSLRNGDEWLGNNLNRAHLDYYYWLLAILSSLWLCLYVFVSRHYLYKNSQL